MTALVGVCHSHQAAKPKSDRLSSCLPITEIRNRQHPLKHDSAISTSVDEFTLPADVFLVSRRVHIRNPDRHRLQPGGLHLLPVLAHSLCAVGHGDLHLLHVTYWRRASGSRVHATFGASSPAA